jgi:hypothetical protein
MINKKSQINIEGRTFVRIRKQKLTRKANSNRSEKTLKATLEQHEPQ